MKLKTKWSVLFVALAFSFASCNSEEVLSSNENASATNVASASNGLTAKVGNCAEVPGWASQNGGTTGGGSSAETTVTTYAQLKSAIESSTVKVIKVTGTITVTTRLSLQDQTGKTIYGTSGAKLVSTNQTKDASGIINIKRCKNLIIRNLIFEGPGAYDTDGWDNAILDDCQNVWVDHCEFRDGVDGNFDIKNKSDYISVTYSKFGYLKPPKAGGSGGSDDHRYSNLIGSSDGATADRGTLRITFARCWWAPGCKERMPRVRFGKVHLINNYFNSTVSNKCIAAGFEANLLVERNSFDGVKTPIDLMTGYTAVTATDNVFANTTGNQLGSNTAFTPPYTIVKLAASAVKADVTAGAGATFTGNTCGSF
ncbi:pectate lyase [Flavobacterium sp. ANB]|uniref:pectate lyase family protein n=1 Tax=unclassified Flavobacterium TaxID=196869 RepID=UPI0012B6B91C|nr:MULTISPECIES: pectate lyase-like adhesive domain-containing protein [unclassified Flavobacterium]MBF4519069.1 pectate lyase [Flavobacterium sp. ANB]MTD71731.1 pectate lyase [Flavobacterium sp. LC2016-13]